MLHSRKLQTFINRSRSLNTVWQPLYGSQR